MKDNTKKWLVTAGLAVVCVGLVFGISRVLYREPVQEILIGEKDDKDVEIIVDIGKAETVQTEEAETVEDTEETLVIKIDTDTVVSINDKEQEIQPEPEKTEKEKPSEPPASSEDADTQPNGETPKEPVKQPPSENHTPKTGDIKDGMMYVEGFGWVPYEGGGGEGIYAEDMYENGNKIGIMD